MTVHATLVNLSGCGVLLLGPSGSGKSDFAIRLLAHTGAHLVADDRVILDVKDGGLLGRAPEALSGLIEARGLGVLRVPCVACSPIHIAVHMTPGQQAERMPDPQRWRWGGVDVPAVTMDPFQVGAVAKLALLACGLAQNRLPVHWDAVT